MGWLFIASLDQLPFTDICLGCLTVSYSGCIFRSGPSILCSIIIMQHNINGTLDLGTGPLYTSLVSFLGESFLSYVSLT